MGYFEIGPARESLTSIAAIMALIVTTMSSETDGRLGERLLGERPHRRCAGDRFLSAVDFGLNSRRARALTSLTSGGRW